VGNIKEKILKILKGYSDEEANLSSEALREQLTNEILGVILLERTNK
tara:strand:- start:313 stop:453 length:141 start_codon:yes stop_codon:yes gene_type:complete